MHTDSSDPIHAHACICRASVLHRTCTYSCSAMICPLGRRFLLLHTTTADPLLYIPISSDSSVTDRTLFPADTTVTWLSYQRVPLPSSLSRKYVTHLHHHPPSTVSPPSFSVAPLTPSSCSYPLPSVHDNARLKARTFNYLSDPFSSSARTTLSPN